MDLFCRMEKPQIHGSQLETVSPAAQLAQGMGYPLDVGYYAKEQECRGVGENQEPQQVHLG